MGTTVAVGARPMKLSLGPLALMVLAGCSSSSPEPPAAGAPSAPAQSATEKTPAANEEAVPDPRLEGRPYKVHVPKGHDDAKPSAILFAFHGYGSGDSGEGLDRYFAFTRAADAHDFLYVAPNGKKDKSGERFWNGTDACCDFDKTNPDDVGYIRAIVLDIAKTHAVDPKRIFAFGLSGGGFFAHRLACEASDLFAGVVSMSGATFEDAKRCTPKEGVSVVEIHGEDDDVVLYSGGRLDFGSVSTPYPSAHDTAQRWAALNGCTGSLADSGKRVDVAAALTGDETRVERYDSCARGAVELWTVEKGSHAPAIAKTFADTMWSFFEAHPK